jgi:hypothetical protein
MTHKDMFDTDGSRPPNKEVLVHGSPGTGKTLWAIRACCANQANALFLKLAGPQLVQMSIGDGAKLIRDAFELANAKIEQGVSAGAILLLLMKLMPLVGIHYDTGNTSMYQQALLAALATRKMTDLFMGFYYLKYVPRNILSLGLSQLTWHNLVRDPF